MSQGRGADSVPVKPYRGGGRGEGGGRGRKERATKVVGGERGGEGEITTSDGVDNKTKKKRAVTCVIGLIAPFFNESRWIHIRVQVKG